MIIIFQFLKSIFLLKLLPVGFQTINLILVLGILLTLLILLMEKFYDELLYHRAYD